MLPEDRFSRQRRVAEVGNVGQTLLCRLTVTLPNRPSSEGDASVDVAATYLSRAGVHVERCSESPPRVFSHAHVFEDASARALAAGAHVALAELRQALELEAPRGARSPRGERAPAEMPGARERVLFP